MKNRENISAYLAKAFSLLLSITLVFPVISSAEPLPSKAPLNPAFLSHFSAPKIKMQQSTPQDSHTYGYIPPPVDYSYLKNLPLVPQGIAIQKVGYFQFAYGAQRLFVAHAITMSQRYNRLQTL